MAQGDPMERGEQKVPLLSKSVSSHGHWSDRKNNGNRAALAAILAFGCFESIAFFGVAANLVVYFDSVFHGSKASNAAAATTWSGTCYVIPFIGAIMADAFMGNFKTVLFSLFIYLPGILMITLTASSPNHKLAFLFGLYIIAVGGGGVRAAIMPFGADQFGDESAEDKESKSSFFSLFYLCSRIGILFSNTLIAWVQVNVSWAIGFGISTACLVLASAAFLLGTPAYWQRTPSGSPLKRVLQVLVAAAEKWRCEAPRDSRLLHELDDEVAACDSGRERLARTDGLGFLDKAAIEEGSGERRRLYDPWSVCTVTQVEEVKILLRLLPIWATGAVYDAVYFQMPTTFIQQGTAMNSTIGGFSIPPSTLSSFEFVSMMICATAYDRLVAPLARRWLGNERGLSTLQRMGVGMVLMVVAMATAAFVEHQRLERARAGGAAMSIVWQLPQFFLVACSETFCLIAQTEFLYDEAPETMKSMCSSLALLAMSVGNFLSSVIVMLVARLTTAPPGGGGGSAAGGWLPDDLDEGHLDYYFWMFAGVSAVNCVWYLACARCYTPKTVIVQGKVAAKV